MSDLLIAFDLETTGLNHTNDRIVTAAVVGDPRFDMHLLINPGIPIPRDATAVHGITDDVAARGVHYLEGLQQIGDTLMRAWAMGAVVVGHNIDRYDLPMLHAQENVHFGQRRTPVRSTGRCIQATPPGSPQCANTREYRCITPTTPRLTRTPRWRWPGC
jgi:DNA polymerase III epsilon subunit-like protein